MSRRVLRKKLPLLALGLVGALLTLEGCAGTIHATARNRALRECDRLPNTQDSRACAQRVLSEQR